VTFPLTFQFLIIFGMGFEVFTVERIHNMVWVRISHSLVHTWLWIFCRSILGLSTHAIRCCSSSSRPHCLCWPFRLHGPITQKPTISNLNSIHFACIVSLCYIKLCTHVRQYIALLFYITLWSEQKCIAGNIMKNRTVYLLVCVLNWIVMILKFYICKSHYEFVGGGGRRLLYRCRAT